MRRTITATLQAGIVSCLLAATPQTSHAQGVPTIDTKQVLQQIQQLQAMAEDFGIQTEQLDQLRAQLDLLQQHLERLENIQALIEDPTQVLSLAMGDELASVLEGDFDLSMLETLAGGLKGDWSGLSDISSGSFTSALDNALASAGVSQEQITAMANSDNTNAKRNATTTTSNAMTSAAAEVAYGEAERMVERTVILVDEIAQLKGLKESVDHNTRVTAELAIAMAALWQLESVQTMNVGLTGVADAATIAEVQKFYDFTLPEIPQ